MMFEGLTPCPCGGATTVTELQPEGGIAITHQHRKGKTYRASALDVGEAVGMWRRYQDDNFGEGKSDEET